MSGSGISWDICKSATCSRQITMPAPHHSVFYRPDALPVAQPTASKHWRQTRNRYKKYVQKESSSWRRSWVASSACGPCETACGPLQLAVAWLPASLPGTEAELVQGMEDTDASCPSCRLAAVSVSQLLSRMQTQLKMWKLGEIIRWSDHLMYLLT